ncbi:CHAT domain-containing protein [Alkalinema sp. FACHB-956]|uniref:CHAT domain-containing protein n=1 Tax=Alkalinema sp. FACHB-956 TaxID=2692768 RepID=UPI0016838430|nr:CHAT domain-containing protein [Alkalinema sp. FACHB-956]
MPRRILVMALTIAACQVSPLQEAAQGQTIAPRMVPANDGTGTILQRQGDRIDITGGQLSGDGTNLFHSFQRFGLNASETANFLANPTLHNILTRVTGGDPSRIDGLLKVTGGNANLFLINPAGIVFGSNARLDVPGAFTATTATGIGFGNTGLNAGFNPEFKSLQTNDYANLNGNPSSLIFSISQPGAIVNAGNLAVNAGQALGLIGGTVFSSGTLSAPGGQVTIASVAGNQVLRLNAPGSLLGFELQPLASTPIAFTPATLPQLLTGGDIQQATGVTLQADGSVKLSHLNQAIAPGDVVVKQLNAGQATVTATNQLTLPDSQLHTSGDLILHAKNSVVARDTAPYSFLANAGGDLTIQGDRGVDLWVLNSSGNNQFPIQSGGNLNLVSDGIISTDAHFQAGKDFSIRRLDSSLANFLSLNDPIINVGGSYGVGDYIGASLQVTAGGDITYNNVTINAIDPSVHPTNPAFFLNAGGTIAGTGLVTTTLNNLLVDFQATGVISTQGINSKGGSITLSGASITASAPYDTTNAGNASGNINLTATSGDLNLGLLRASATGSVGLVGPGGSVNLTATTGNITANQIQAFSRNVGSGNSSNGGTISINAANGFIFTSGLDSFSETTNGNAGNGGAITLNAFNSITIDSGGINTRSASAGTGTASNGGIITATNSNGNIAIVGNSVLSVARSFAGSAGSGGAINIAAGNGDVVIDPGVAGQVASHAAVENGSGVSAGNGGNITLSGNNVTIQGVGLLSGSEIQRRSTLTSGNTGNGGNITVNASNTATLPGQFRSESVTPVGTAGNGGNINVSAGNLLQLTAVTPNAITALSSGNLSAGSGGTIALSAPTIGIAPGAATPGNPLRFNAPTQINRDTSTEIPFPLSNPLSSNAVTMTGNLGSGVEFMEVSSSAGTVTFNGDLNLASLKVNDRQSTAFYGNHQIGSLDLVGGATTLLNGSITTNAPLTLRSNVVVQGNSFLNSNSNAILFNGTIEGQTPDTNSLTIDAGSAPITINQPIGATTSLGQLVLQTSGLTQLNNTIRAESLITQGSGSTEINGNITTTNSQTYSETVQISNPNLILTSTNNGDISFDVNVQAIGDLTVNTGGNSKFFGTVNARSLTTDSAGVTQLYSDVTTTQNQLYGDTLQIGLPAVNLQSLNGSLTFGSTIDGRFGQRAPAIFTAQAPNGSLSFAGSLGGISPLRSVTLLAGQSLNLGQSIVTTGGEVNLAGSQVTTRDITTNGGNILINSGSTINTQAGTLNTTPSFGSGGNVTLNAPGDITTGNIQTSANATAGNIQVTSANGIITSGDLTATGAVTGGNVTVNARTSMSLGAIDTHSDFGNGGNVLLDPINDVVVRFINAQGQQNGGTVDITTGRFFRATDSFVDRNGFTASISTAADTLPGTITLRHYGGYVSTPFEIGNPAINGTAGEITMGLDNRLEIGQSFPYFYTQGVGSNLIQLITANAPIVIPIESPQPNLNPPNNFSLPLLERPPKPPEFVQRPMDATPPPMYLDPGIGNLEARFSRAVQNYYGQASKPNFQNLDDMQSLAQNIEKETGAKPAFVYISFLPDLSHCTNLGGSEQCSGKQETDNLEIIAVTAKGNPIRKVLYNVTRQEVLQVAKAFRSTVTDRDSNDYLKPGQQLYQWFVAPMEAEFQQRNINNLLFMMDSGLRSLPLSALYDGKGFLVERYSVGMTPSLSLMDTRYRDIKGSKLFAMGASQFTDQPALPAVPVELSLISQEWQNGQVALNDQFTISNLMEQRSRNAFGILHLATHGEFRPGQPQQSYIQFWNHKLQLNQIRDLKLHDPPLELLVLSACRMAVGDDEAELGFAGLATQAGVKSALASLWYVDDEGTLALMTEVYRQLEQPQVKIKAEALRQSQMALIRGDVRINQGALYTPVFDKPIPLPPNVGQGVDRTFKHPYYWAAFTLVGNPW